MSRWAVLNEDKVAINIIEGERLEGLMLPLGQSIVNIDNYQVTIGDSYADDIWTNENGHVPHKLTQEQEIAQLKAMDAARQQQIDDLSILVLQLGGALIG